MERRWGMRKAVEIDVVIDNQPECLLRGQIGNVSVGGLYVRTAEPGSLSKNSQVELVLMLQQDTGTHVYRMAAMVVRLTDDGAGLMFDQYDVNAFRALVVLLLAKQKASAATAAADNRSNTFSFSIDGDADVASVLEGTTGRAAGAARTPCLR
jgi:hypothetical protein